MNIIALKSQHSQSYNFSNAVIQLNRMVFCTEVNKQTSGVWGSGAETNRKHWQKYGDPLLKYFFCIERFMSNIYSISHKMGMYALIFYMKLVINRLDSTHL